MFLLPVSFCLQLLNPLYFQMVQVLLIKHTLTVLGISGLKRARVYVSINYIKPGFSGIWSLLFFRNSLIVVLMLVLRAAI
jgi:hypothetical protein